MPDAKAEFFVDHCTAAHTVGLGPMVAYHLVSNRGEGLMLCVKPDGLLQDSGDVRITSEAEYEASL